MPVNALSRPSLRWFWIRLVGGSVILAAVVWRLGTGPILSGVHRVSLPAVVAALLITAVTTAGSAWRWTRVARHFGLSLSVPAAVAACYRSQFLNTTLPGGILGDVSRAVDHGQQSGQLGCAVRSVVWDRSLGQLVQVGSTALLLLVIGWPARWLIGLVGMGLLLVLGALLRRVRSLPPELGALARPGVMIASLVVLAGHTAVLLIAFRAVGVTGPPTRLLALAMLVLLAAALPLNVGGWGPREGAAAALFAGAGLSSGAGVSVAAADGVLVTVACLPGAVVLLVGWAHRLHRPQGTRRSERPRLEPRALIKGASGG